MWNIFSTSDVISFLSFIITAIVGYISIRVAKNSLAVSQRSMLIKESYEPILNDIKNNRNTTIDTSRLLDFKNLADIKNSYVYLAFDDEMKRVIESILKSQEEINLLKRKTEYFSTNAMTKVLNENLVNKGFEEEIEYISLESTSKTKFYDILMKKQFFRAVRDNSPTIYCVIGESYVYTNSEGIEIEDFERKYQISLSGFFSDFFDLRFTTLESTEEYYADIEKLEDKVIMELKSHTDYISMELEYKALCNHLNQLEEEIISRIKELIIPGYKKPRMIISKMVSRCQKTLGPRR
ncbi:hypothetical protein ACQVTX_17255 [Bacillus pretiosus]|uniref:hypothetical protein n=1 Tax=Bacillus pretiosus TaxID=2983392 RepID=UPI003D657D59